jgi:hypothetical protein
MRLYNKSVLCLLNLEHLTVLAAPWLGCIVLQLWCMLCPWWWRSCDCITLLASCLATVELLFWILQLC